MPVSPVSPTQADRVAASGSAFLGGPLGRFARPSPQPVRRAVWVIIGLGTLTYLVGVLRTFPCISNSWELHDRFEHLCYSDIPTLYIHRGLADGYIPNLEWPAGGQPLEYPVLTGALMWVAALITALLTGGEADPTTYYFVNLVLLYAFFLAALISVSLTVPRRVWDGLLFALAPSLALAATINWDMQAVGFTALAMFAWARQRPALSGVLFGLGIAAKFYPLLILGPLLVLAWRRRRMAVAGRTIAWAAFTWLIVNLPVAAANTTGWLQFFTFSAERGEDFGSLWLALKNLGWGIDPEIVNRVGLAVFVVLCAGIAGLILAVRVPPRFAQVAFLVVAAFLVTNKVYSPQFVLWLVPLAVLARPRWRDFLIWQAGEAVYFVAVWWYLVDLGEGNTGLDERLYAGASLIHIGATVFLMGVVVRDVLRPDHDPVRTDDAPPGKLFDDPGGGVFDGAPVRTAWLTPEENRR